MLLWSLVHAYGHGLDAHRAQVEHDGVTFRVTATPGLGLWPSADTDGDGVLTKPEVAAARAALGEAFAARFALLHADGTRLPCDDVSVSTIGEGADHVRVSLRCPAEDPAVLLRIGPIDGAPLTVQARAIRSVGLGQWTTDRPPTDHAVGAEGGTLALFGATLPPASPGLSGFGLAFAALTGCAVLWNLSARRTLR